MKHRTVLALVPLAALCAAPPLASAAGENLLAVITGDGVPQDGVGYDCNRRNEIANTNRGHIQARAQAIDSCGNPTMNPNSVVATQSGNTTAAKARVNRTPWPGTCGTWATRHRVTLETHWWGPTGVDMLHEHCRAESTCWTGANCAATCTSPTPIWTALTPVVVDNAMQCQNRSWTAKSDGLLDQ